MAYKKRINILSGIKNLAIIPSILWLIFGFLVSIFWNFISIFLLNVPLSKIPYYINILYLSFLGYGYIVGYGVVHPDHAARKLLSLTTGLIVGLMLTYGYLFSQLSIVALIGMTVVGIILGIVGVLYRLQILTYLFVSLYSLPYIGILITTLQNGLKWIVKNKNSDNFINALLSGQYSIYNALLFLGGIALFILFSKNIKPIKLRENIKTCFIGPKAAGKTVLSIGLYHYISQKGGNYEKEWTINRVGEHNYTPLVKKYLYFENGGFYEIGATERLDFVHYEFEIYADPKEKLMFGAMDVLMENMDYAGEIIPELSEILRSEREYKSYKSELINTIKQLNLPKGNVIIKDIEMDKFDFRKYDNIIDWKELDGFLRFVPIHVYCQIKSSNKIVFLMDGIKLLSWLYYNDPVIKSLIDNLEEKNPTLYNYIIENNILDTEVSKSFGDSIYYYRTMISSLDEGVDYIVAITKSDLLLAIYNYNVAEVTDDDYLKLAQKKLYPILSKHPVFKDIIISKNKLYCVSVLSRKDIQEIYGNETCGENIVVRGLDKIVKWATEEPIIKKLLW